MFTQLQRIELNISILHYTEAIKKPNNTFFIVLTISLVFYFNF